MRVQQALAAFAFPAYQYPPPKPHLTPSGECRSLFISGMHGKAENAPSTVSGRIIHTANSYALTGLEMETVRDNQGKKVRYDDTQRPLLLSTSGNAAHALLLLPQAAQLWARALYPQVEGCGLPAAVRARISSVEASLTMCPALAHERSRANNARLLCLECQLKTSLASQEHAYRRRFLFSLSVDANSIRVHSALLLPSYTSNGNERSGGDTE